MVATLHYDDPYSQSCGMDDLSGAILELLENFYNESEEEPVNVYDMVTTEVEKPLFEIIMKHTNHNQSEATQILGLNRGTFRDKLKKYGMLPSKSSDDSSVTSG